jgi:mono/diheme cytochrome c family protein
MLGIKAPNLRRAELFTDRSEDELLVQVLYSKPLSVVPDTARLTPTEEDIDAIAAYMRRLPHIPWEQIDTGQQLYDAVCVSCHGPYGRGDGLMAASLPTPTRDLSAPDYQRQVGDADLRRIIAAGRGLMPRVGDIMTPEQIQAILGYVRLLSPGYELYSRFCAVCHGFDGHPTVTKLEAAWKHEFPPTEIPQAVFDQAYFLTRSATSIRRGIGHILQQGRAIMPHFDGALSEDEVRQILSHVRSLPREQDKPSSQR